MINLAPPTLRPAAGFGIPAGMVDSVSAAGGFSDVCSSPGVLFALQPLVYFLPMNGNFGGALETELYLIAAYLQHSDGDRPTDDDLLSSNAGKN